VARTPAWWETHAFLDRPARRMAGGALAVVVHTDADGAVDGWALYRAHLRWEDRLPRGTLHVEDLMAVDDAVHLALWRILLDHDLVAEVDLVHASLGDPIRWALVDARRLRSSEITDWLWLRLLDVPRALSSRRWGAAGRVVLEVPDRVRPPSGGRFLVEADATGAGRVARTDAPADVVLGPEELGAVALGDVAPSTLARVGRVRERRAGALAVADALFRTEVTPHCATMF
jgi:predicted acetyltransferase